MSITGAKDKAFVSSLEMTAAVPPLHYTYTQLIKLSTNFAKVFTIFRDGRAFSLLKGKR